MNSMDASVPVRPGNYGNPDERFCLQQRQRCAGRPVSKFQGRVHRREDDCEGTLPRQATVVGGIRLYDVSDDGELDRVSEAATA